jgi:hypothetical protein
MAEGKMTGIGMLFKAADHLPPDLRREFAIVGAGAF